MGVAGYLQKNSGVWLESRSIPYLAAATVRAGWRLCHLALHGHREMERVWASSAALTPSLPPFSPGLIYRHQASPLCPAQKPWPSLWSASGPAAHYVKGPAAPCHTAHLPGCRPECGIREERHTERSRNPELLSSLLTSPHHPADKRCTIMRVAVTQEKLRETNKTMETNSVKIQILQGRRCFSSTSMIFETSDG